MIDKRKKENKGDPTYYTVFPGVIKNDHSQMLPILDRINLLSDLYNLSIHKLYKSISGGFKGETGKRERLLPTYHGVTKFLTNGLYGDLSEEKKLKKTKKDGTLSYHSLGTNSVKAVIGAAYSHYMEMIRDGNLKVIDSDVFEYKSLVLFSFSEKSKVRFTSEGGLIIRKFKLELQFEEKLRGKPSRAIIRYNENYGDHKWRILLFCVPGSKEDDYPWKSNDFKS